MALWRYKRNASLDAVFCSISLTLWTPARNLSGPRQIKVRRTFEPIIKSGLGTQAVVQAWHCDVRGYSGISPSDAVAITL